MRLILLGDTLNAISTIFWEWKTSSSWDFQIPFSELNCCFAYICLSVLGFFLLTALCLFFFLLLCREERSHNYLSIRFLLEWFFSLINAILLLVTMLGFWLPFDKAYWKSVCFISCPAEDEEINTVLKKKKKKVALTFTARDLWGKFTVTRAPA